MKEKSSVFMTYGTTLGMLIGVIITVVILLFYNQYTYLALFIILGLGALFRVLGFYFDRIVDSKYKR